MFRASSFMADRKPRSGLVSNLMLSSIETVESESDKAAARIDVPPISAASIICSVGLVIF